MLTLIKKIDVAINPLRDLAENFLSPAFDLVMRLYIANVFWASGSKKLDNFLNEDFESTVFSFEEVHPVPGLDPVLGAAAATITEPLFAVLLALGLFGRGAALGLLVTTIVIEYAWAVQQTSYTFPVYDDHLLWGFLCLALVLRGPGKFSLDTLLLKFLRK